MIDFLLPLGIAIFGGNKFFCNHLCGRGQLFSKLGGDLKCSQTILDLPCSMGMGIHCRNNS